MRETADISDLSAEDAYTVGKAIGQAIHQGMPISNATDATHTIAEFVRKGQAAQQAVDEILAAYARKADA